MAPVCEPRALQGAGMYGRRDGVICLNFFVFLSPFL